MLNTPEQAVRDFIATQYTRGGSPNIQVLCSYEDLLKQFDRISQQWVNVGLREPYASVLSEDKYKPAFISENIDEFNLTGKHAVDNFYAVCEKNDVPVPNGTLFELGCGVGRSTQYLAPAFEKISGWDVSDGNLRECRNNLLSKNISNVELRQLHDLSDFNSVPNFDVFFSEIVIQHNTPPLQYFILDKIFYKMNPGGVFYFQTITHHETYAFNVDSYLNWKHEQSFEMHALPMRWVNKVIRRNGLFLMDVIKERLGGYNLDSHTFFGIKQV